MPRASVSNQSAVISPFGPPISEPNQHDNEDTGCPAAAATRPTADYAGEARPATSDSRAPDHDHVNPAANRLSDPHDHEKIISITPGPADCAGMPGNAGEGFRNAIDLDLGLALA